MAILALIVIPVSTGMVTAFKMNAKAEKLMHAELVVSSAVESLMSTGINGTQISKESLIPRDVDGELIYRVEDFDFWVTPIPETVGENIICYEVTVKSKEVDDVTVVTYIRAVDSVDSTKASTEEEGG